VAATLALVAFAISYAKRSGTAASSAAPGAVAPGQAHPTTAPGEHGRLLPVPPAPTGSGDYQLMIHQPGAPNTPVGFDPCRAVHFVVNPAGAPADGVAQVRDAFETVSRATGLKFVDDGTTTESPSRDRPDYEPRRYGDRWAPILIAWSDETRYPDLAGYIAGVGTPHPVQTVDGHLVLTSGQVVLDGAQLDPLQMPDRTEARALLLHELGHVVGLAHTADRNEIMFSEAQLTVQDYGPGDLMGLRAVGSRSCDPDL
jgi:hypothetical protein